MKNDEFYILVEQWFKERKEIMVPKGVEYTISSDDKLANFKRVATRVGLNPLNVAMIYTLKHVDSLCNFVKTGKEASDEGIEGRIMDIQNYMDLIRAIILEQRREEDEDFKKTEEADLF